MLKKVFFAFAGMICILPSLGYTQFPMSFMEITKNAEYGSAINVAVDNAGKVFLANNEGGLWVFGYDMESFTDIAHVNNGGNASAIAVGVDGTVFLANGMDGLRVYSLDGAKFTNTAHWAENLSTYGVSDVAVSPNGTIFLANSLDGLRAFTYADFSLTNTSHIQDAGEYTNELHVVSDSLLFLTGRNNNNLRAYSFNGTDFTLLAKIYVSRNSCGVTMREDSTVFLANLDNGIRVYKFTGDMFTEITPLGQQILDNKHIFSSQYCFKSFQYSK